MLFFPNWLPERFGVREIKHYENSGHWTPVDEHEAFAGEWNRWFLVETVANDPDMRRELMQLRDTNTRENILIRKKSWIETVDRVLERLWSGDEV